MTYTETFFLHCKSKYFHLHDKARFHFYYCQHRNNGIIKSDWHGMICKIKMQGINENPQNASEEL